MNKFLNGIKYFFSTMFDDVATKFFTGLLFICTFIATLAILACFSSIFGKYFLLGILLVALIPYLVGHVITVIEEKHYIKQRIKEEENTPKPPQPQQPKDYYF